MDLLVGDLAGLSSAVRAGVEVLPASRVELRGRPLTQKRQSKPQSTPNTLKMKHLQREQCHPAGGRLGWPKYLPFRVIRVFRGPNGAFPGVANAGRVVGQAWVKPPRSHPAIFIRSVDVAGRLTRGPGQAAGYVSECGEPFYGTRVGPGWYESGTSVPRGCKLPFSVLRMLMQPSRKPLRMEGRRQSTLRSAATADENAECRAPGQSHPKPPQSHISATSMRHQCVLIANRLRL
jgi:hypothetical protein